MSKEENEQKHLDHWLYKEASGLTEIIRKEQILKGAAKYDIPLGDATWTPLQLVYHALQENIDQNHYLTMLIFKIRELELEVSRLQVFEQWYKEKPLD